MFIKKEILLALVVFLASLANAAKTITPKTPALVGGCYEISSAEELYGFASLVNDVDSYFTGCAKLTADIVVNEGVLTEDDSLNVADTANFVVWNPIDLFAGTFDGQGHTISGLYRDYHNLEYEWNVVGFFTGLGNGDEDRTIVVRNLGIVGSFFRAKSHAGAIVGAINDNKHDVWHTDIGANVLIENCSSHVRIETESFYENVGGIVGYVAGHATIRNCSAFGLVVGKTNDMGGIVGIISVEYATLKDQPVIVENCSSKMRISGKPDRAGGIVGRMNGWAKILNGKNYGEVVGDTAGGIVGSTSGSITVANSFNEASVVKGNHVAGGIVGSLGGAIVMNCYNKGAVSGIGIVGGLFGYVSSCRYIAGAYSTFQIEVPRISPYQSSLIGSFKGMSYKALTSAMENVFYVETEWTKMDSVGNAAPAELFENGTVAYMLRNYTYRVSDFDGTVWGQDVGIDPSPVFKDGITGMSSNAMAGLILHTYKGDPLVYPDKYVPGYDFRLPDAYRDGYFFEGWFENEDLTGDVVTNILADSEGDRELWAKLSKIRKITYNTVGGAVDTSAAKSYVEGTGLTLTHKVLRDGYVFAGWYAKSNYSGNRVTEITAEETGDKVFYAKWLQKETPSKDTDGCYVIKTAMELYGFAAIVNGTDGFEQNTSACASLAKDIVVNQNVIDENGVLNEAEKDLFLEWTPMMEFNGVFDGTFHSVSGLYFNDTLDEDREGSGFFGTVDKNVNYENVAIRNLGIEKSFFAAKGSVGALVGKILPYEYWEQGDVEIAYCYSTSTVHGYDGNSWRGAAGGLVGGSFGVTNLYIENCYNVGHVEYKSGMMGGYCGGGLVGWKHYEDKNSLTIVNSYNVGPVFDITEDELVYDLVCYAEDNMTVENSYYPKNEEEEECCGTSLAMGMFRNGTVARLLHGGKGGAIWGQDVGVDEYPNFSGIVKNYSGIEHAVNFHTFDGDTSTYFTSYMQGIETVLPDTVKRAGFDFLGWYADSALSGEPVKSITKEATDSLDFYAKWEKLRFEVIVKVDVIGRGKIVGLKDGKVYEYGEKVSVEARPADNYKFAYWADDENNTNPVLKFKVVSDTTIVAHFDWVPPSSSSSAKSSSSGKSSSSSKKGGKDGLAPVAQAPQFMLTTVGREILVSGASESARSYTLFDMQGHVLCKGSVPGGNFTIPVKSAGNYLVRIGAHAQRVSVR